MNDDINKYLPSLLNPRCVKKHDLSLTQNSIVSRSSLSLKRVSKVLSERNNKRIVAAIDKNVTLLCSTPKVNVDKENSPNSLIQESQVHNNVNLYRTCSNQDSLGISAIQDILTNYESSPFSFGDPEENNDLYLAKNVHLDSKAISSKAYKEESLISVSSATELYEQAQSESTVIKCTYKPVLNVSFGVNNCKCVDVTAINGVIRRFVVTNNDNNTNVDCEVQETSQISTETEQEVDENMNETSTSQLKRSAVAVNLEIKKQKLSETDRTEDSKVLILNTNAIEKISHVIVQPPNYRFEKRNLPKNKFKSNNKSVGDGSCTAGLKQIKIDSFFRQSNVSINSSDKYEDAEEMSRNLGVSDAIKCERVTRSAKVYRRESTNETPRSARLNSKREVFSPRRDVKTSNSEAPSPTRVGSALSPRQNVESIHFTLPAASAKTIKKSLSPRSLPHHKIVAGTHFAVDAFSYGDIPNVKHYFLTHFHSDHYTGLKKTFNKLLFCSKITADLCISRLGVNSKFIHIIGVDETLRIDGVEVTAVDANHCPGALMLVFTLPNGKTLLHTGDFRACPSMESYPVFWNRDIHTIYLDTTYCNPRYDFPTQDQSLEMAVYILRQKKMALEKAGKKFASVLIVCGTYTIGKEKFFLGMSRRVGCSVWACPEKERVLQTVEGKPSTREAPQACQLHVVPMRDLTHEKLRSYLDSLQGAFTEVVAFKPSGWENGKNSSVEKDCVTIHGIPYSEHSSFSELVRFVKFLKPKQVVPTVDISGGAKAVQKYFPCPLVYKDELLSQNKMTDYFSIQSRQMAGAVT